MSADRRRLALAVLLSLLIHAPLLSLTVGGQRFGLPGFVFPWQERRLEAPELQVVLASAKVIAAVPAEPSRTLVNEPLQQAPIEPIVADRLTLKPSLALSKIPALMSSQTVEVISPQAARMEPVAPPTEASITPDMTTGAVAAIAPAPVVIAVERSAEPTFAVPPPSPAPTPVIAVATSAPITPEPDVRERAVEVAKLDPPKPESQSQRQADQLEAARVEATRLEAARVEAGRAEAARLETQRREATRLAEAKLETQRQEIARHEAARIEAARLEAARLDAARLETQRQEATRQAAAKLETQRQEVARQEAVRQAAVQATAEKDAARIQERKEEDAKRAARREAMGRVLNEEAAKRDAAATAARTPSTSSTLPYSLSTARRGRLWGRFDTNAELVQYAETWARKIQFNTSLDTIREVAKRPHNNPMLTVAIRSDGSVESVTFVVSSGVAEVDEAIRRIVQSNVPYPTFPPGLAREYDVIEVRRTWHFDTAVRLY